MFLILQGGDSAPDIPIPPAQMRLFFSANKHLLQQKRNGWEEGGRGRYEHHIPSCFPDLNPP